MKAINKFLLMSLVLAAAVGTMTACGKATTGNLSAAKVRSAFEAAGYTVTEYPSSANGSFSAGGRTSTSNGLSQNAGYGTGTDTAIRNNAGTGTSIGNTGTDTAIGNNSFSSIRNNRYRNGVVGQDAIGRDYNRGGEEFGIRNPMTRPAPIMNGVSGTGTEGRIYTTPVMPSPGHRVNPYSNSNRPQNAGSAQDLGNATRTNINSGVVGGAYNNSGVVGSTNNSGVVGGAYNNVTRPNSANPYTNNRFQDRRHDFNRQNGVNSGLGNVDSGRTDINRNQSGINSGLGNVDSNRTDINRNQTNSGLSNSNTNNSSVGNKLSSAEEQADILVATKGDEVITIYFFNDNTTATEATKAESTLDGNAKNAGHTLKRLGNIAYFGTSPATQILESIR